MIKNSANWTDLVKELIDAKRILARVLCEDYLAVSLGIRLCSFLTMPAELPDGENIGRTIDESCQQDISKLVAEININVKKVLIADLKNKLRRNYGENLYKSESFRAHICLAKKLGLRSYETEVRPTIHEIYFFKSSDVKAKLVHLMNVRQAARQKSLHRGQESNMFLAIYPEECLPDYMRSMGKLLGYPTCCIDKYIKDRISETVSVEERASGQIKKLRECGAEPDHFAYFSRGFFPCTPTCSNAIEMGKQVYDGLKKIDPDIGSHYLKVIQENLEFVEGFPELIKKHMQRLEGRAQQFGQFRARY